MTYKLTYKTKNGLKFLTAEELLKQHSIFVAFTTREKGASLPPYQSLNLSLSQGDNPQTVRENRKILCASLNLDYSRLTMAKQVHSNSVAVIHNNGFTGNDASQKSVAPVIPKADALVTSLKRVPLALFFADCLPIVLADPVNKAVAVVHAGWRGTLTEIAANALVQMTRVFQSSPSDILVFFGPSIGPCCYEVTPDRLRLFRENFSAAAVNDTRLNLEKTNQLILENLGVPDENFYSANICTSCQNSLFFSYRREEITGRQGALACII